MAAILYLDEHNGYFPAFNIGPPLYAQYLYFKLAPYLNISTNTQFDTQAHFLQWQSGQSVYWCPAVEVKDRSSYFSPGGAVWTHYFSSYGYNLELSTDFNVTMRNISEYRGKESTSVLFYEWRVKQLWEGGIFTWDPWIMTAARSIGAYSGPRWAQYVIDKPAHFGRNYFTFMDGHVQGINTRPAYSDYVSADMQWLP